jgi:hypothetical protein
VHRDWPRLWCKQFKIEALDHRLICLNRMRPRLGFRSLRQLCGTYTPVHVYMSVLNWLMPERVASRRRSKGAYPIGGEYVVDVDHYLNYQYHPHHTEEESVCLGCLSNAKQLTHEVLDVIRQYYEDIRVVFSGSKGYHIHCLDFEVTDWTHYDPRNPLKSHEVARRRFTEVIKSSCPRVFDDSHYVLSNDVTRVISFPESLNGETGLTCSYLGRPRDFERFTVKGILGKARASKHVVQGLNWVQASEWVNPRFNRIRSPEPRSRVAVIPAQKTVGRAR